MDARRIDLKLLVSFEFEPALTIPHETYEDLCRRLKTTADAWAASQPGEVVSWVTKAAP